MKKLSFTLALALTATTVSTVQADATTYKVTKTADTSDGSCDSDCSLREAIIVANAQPDSDVVSVPAGLYELTGADTGPDQETTGDLDVSAPVSINGAGADKTTLAGRDDRVLETSTAETGFAAGISGLTMRNGFALTGAGVHNGDGVTLTD